MAPRARAAGDRRMVSTGIPYDLQFERCSALQQQFGGSQAKDFCNN